MVKLYRCIVCGDGYIGTNAPPNCPFCGAHVGYILEAKDAQVNFDVPLSAKDQANVEHALKVEISNSAFYACAANQTNDPEGKILFKALGKIEAEHASIWKKILKTGIRSAGKRRLPHGECREFERVPRKGNQGDRILQKVSQPNSDHPRIRQLFEALVEIETDHLQLSEERLK